MKFLTYLSRKKEKVEKERQKEELKHNPTSKTFLKLLKDFH